MNEAQRLVYLEALGIQQWVAKAPLANAKPTEFITLNLLVDFQENTEAQLPEEPIDLASEVNNPQKDKISSLNDKNNLSKEIETRKTEQVSQSVEKPQEKAKQAVLACAFQIQGKRGQYLLLADLQDKRGKINQTEQNLLNNIGKAIDSLLSNTSTRAITPEQFKWPMFESHFKAEHIDQSEQAAKESAQAFLQSNIKRNELPLVIALGQQTHHLFELENLVQSQKYAKTRFILGASLSEMMQENSKAVKADLWEKLTQ